MIGIKNYDMPYNCYDCEPHNYHECNLTSESIEDDYCWNGDSREKHCPLVEAIPKSDYEARLKADMITLLTEIQLDIEEFMGAISPNYDEAAQDISKVIHSKINALKGENVKHE